MNLTELIQQIFPSRNEQVRAIDDMKSLQANAGWQAITRILTFHIQGLEQQILENEELTQQQAKDLKIQRFDSLFFRDLPDDLLKDLLEATQEQEDDDEVYEGFKKDANQS